MALHLFSTSLHVELNLDLRTDLWFCGDNDTMRSVQLDADSQMFYSVFKKIIFTLL